MSLPKVSVLMPCYNAARTLEVALESIASQTLADFELIVIDDGSQDGSDQILAEWARRDQRYKIYPQSHQGIVAALSSGLGVCQADYVARMDADDSCRPERLARQVAFLDDHPEVAVVSCLVEGFPLGQVGQGYQIYMDWLNSLVSNEAIRREIFVESPVAHPSVVFRKDWVERVGGYQERGWPEDYDLWLRLYLIGAQFGKVPEVLYSWREHPERLTRTDGRYSLENFLRTKAYYLACGPLADCDGVILWGAGMVGRRISKHLLRNGVQLAAFIDIDPRKIGRTRRGLPILPPEELMDTRKRYSRPAVLSAVGARGARHIIRERLNGLGLVEGRDWWGVA